MLLVLKILNVMPWNLLEISEIGWVPAIYLLALLHSPIFHSDGPLYGMNCDADYQMLLWLKKIVSFHHITHITGNVATLYLYQLYEAPLHEPYLIWLARFWAKLNCIRKSIVLRLLCTASIQEWITHCRHSLSKLVLTCWYQAHLMEFSDLNTVDPLLWWCLKYEFEMTQVYVDHTIIWWNVSNRWFWYVSEFGYSL